MMYLLVIQLLFSSALTTYAFHVHPLKYTKKQTNLFISLNFQEPEWRNDDYLNNLSKPQEQREDDAQRYHEQIEKIRESKMRMEEWKNHQPKSKPTNLGNENPFAFEQKSVRPAPRNPSGGTRFQDMMDRSKKLKDSMNGRKHFMLEQMYNLDIDDDEMP